MASSPTSSAASGSDNLTNGITNGGARITDQDGIFAKFDAYPWIRDRAFLVSHAELSHSDHSHRPSPIITPEGEEKKSTPSSFPLHSVSFYCKTIQLTTPHSKA